MDPGKYLENWFPGGVGESLEQDLPSVGFGSTNPGDVCNMTPTQRLNTPDKILTSVPGSTAPILTRQVISCVCEATEEGDTLTLIYC